MDEATTFTAFAGHRGLAAGSLGSVAAAAKAAHDQGHEPILVFDDATGRTVELDLRGTPDEVLARLPTSDAPPKPARGRPRLGVTAREVTLLPRRNCATLGSYILDGTRKSNHPVLDRPARKDRGIAALLRESRNNGPGGQQGRGDYPRDGGGGG